MGYNHNLYISITDVSSTGFRVNATFVAGQNSYNAYGFTVNTDVDGFDTRYHTVYIGSRGGSASWSDYYSVTETGLYDRTYSCSAWADTSWSSNGCDSGNPVRASVTVPKRAYNDFSYPSFSSSKSTANYGENVQLSWSKGSEQGNAWFDHFELWQGGNRLYSGSGVAMSVRPSDVTGAKGGTVTYTLKEVHEWYGTYPSKEISLTIKVRSGVVSAYDASGVKHTALVTAYDSSGKSHYVLITAYDSSGKPHSVV